MDIPELSGLWETGADQLSAFLSGLWEKGIGAFADFVAALPSFLFTLTVTILASLLITMDYKNIAAFLARQLPEKYCRWIGETKVNLLQTMGGMCKAYLILMLVTFGELFVSLLLLRVENALLISAVISIADLLPLIGTAGLWCPGCFWNWCRATIFWPPAWRCPTPSFLWCGVSLNRRSWADRSGSTGGGALFHVYRCQTVWLLGPAAHAPSGAYH